VIRYMTACNKTSNAVRDFKVYILTETLAVEIEEVESKDDFFKVGISDDNLSIQEIEGSAVVISLQRTQA